MFKEEAASKEELPGIVKTTLENESCKIQKTRKAGETILQVRGMRRGLLLRGRSQSD